MIKRTVLILLYAVLPAVFVGLYFAGNLYSLTELFEPYNLSIAAGGAAFIIFMGQFLLSARLPLPERLFGQDRLLLFHRVMGMAAAALVLLHFLLKYIIFLRGSGPTVQSSLGFAALVITVILTLAAAVVFMGGRGNYTRTKAFHNLFALAGFLALIHVLTASSTWSMLLKTVAAVWGFFCLGAYVYHKIIRPKNAVRLKLTALKRPAPDVCVCRFSGEDVPHKPGQFAYFRFSDPRSEEHPFTLSNPPGHNPEITIRAVGDFTRTLLNVPAGTSVYADGVYGRFTPDRLPPGTPLICIAGGIGITPFLSMIRDHDIRSRHPVHLLWSVRNPDDVKAAQGLPEDISLNIVYTRKAPEGLPVRRISPEDLKSMTEPGQAVFLCGPDSFRREIKRQLKKNGVRRIFEERFS